MENGGSYIEINFGIKEWMLLIVFGIMGIIYIIYECCKIIQQFISMIKICYYKINENHV